MVTLTKNIKVKMRDGVLLSGDLYRPDSDDQYPAVIMRTPYNKNGMETCKDYSDPYLLAEKGYNVFIQDVRGCYSSEGVLKSTGENEINDGYDTVEWAAVQPWCNGMVGMYGLSYFGYTQLAAAEQRPPHLVAICPFEMSGLYPFSVGKTCTMNTYHLMWLYSQALGNLEASDIKEEEKQRLKDKLLKNMNQIPEMLNILPLRDIPAAYVDEFPLLKDFIEILDNIDNPAFKKRIHNPLDFENMNVAMLHCAGWYDLAHEGVVGNYEEALRKASTERMEKGQKLILGPWVHGGDFSNVIDHVDFGEHASGKAFGMAKKTQDWFDYWLKGIDNGIMEEPPIDLFVMGVNQWRKEKEWPLKRTLYKNFYLHSNGNANTLNGDGRLSQQLPGDEKEDRYTYNPGEPVPSLAQDYSGARVIQELSEIEKREDILVYQTEVLDNDMEVTGHIKIELFISTDVVDTDFMCKLLDIHPDGKRYALSSGVTRVRYRNSLKPEFMESGKIYEVAVDMGTTSNVFLKGHKVGVEITSSSFPNIDRNLNTGVKIGAGSDYLIAHHKIYHNQNYASKLILPVIPSEC
jgi:putative CocE/NonD family hydrolase